MHIMCRIIWGPRAIHLLIGPLSKVTLDLRGLSKPTMVWGPKPSIIVITPTILALRTSFKIKEANFKILLNKVSLMGLEE